MVSVLFFGQPCVNKPLDAVFGLAFGWVGICPAFHFPKFLHYIHSGVKVFPPLHIRLSDRILGFIVQNDRYDNRRRRCLWLRRGRSRFGFGQNSLFFSTEGKGPAWANSLFEDNAEYGYGFNLAYAQRRSKLADMMRRALELNLRGRVGEAFKLWLENKKSADVTKQVAKTLEIALPSAIKNNKGELKEILKEVEKSLDCVIKKSIWIIGGDGWAYDIGYGGLDHVLAMGEDVNVLVVDTEVYSNTGGQASKSTPTGSVAKFAAGGKRVKKKDLGMMAMSYGYVYVAQCSMGANKQQFLNAIVEAEAYDGPSLLICYAPCINHGIKMSNSQIEGKKAVDAGYWHLYRYNPEKIGTDVNPFTLDSKDPTASYKDFLLGENRYATLKKSQPELAERLFETAEEENTARLNSYKKLANK